jgi:hypothetical protein
LRESTQIVKRNPATGLLFAQILFQIEADARIRTADPFHYEDWAKESQAVSGVVNSHGCE